MERRGASGSADGHMTQDPGVRCRFMERADVPRVIELMGQGPLSLAGVSSPNLHRALCRDALRNPRLLITVAECEGTVAAFLVTALDWKRTQRAFVMRHPLLGCAMLVSRLRRRSKSGGGWSQLTPERQQVIRAAVEPETSGRAWKEASSGIAKVVFVQADRHFRRRGLSIALYRHLFRWLVDQGIRRIDACVGLTNVAALPLHRRAGYRLEVADGYLFATADLVEDAAPLDAAGAIENRV